MQGNERLNKRLRVLPQNLAMSMVHPAIKIIGVGWMTLIAACANTRPPEQPSRLGYDMLTRTARAIDSQGAIQAVDSTLILRHLSVNPSRPLNVLSISGGGNGGAFGAGALAGLSETGTRPTFDLVTGISSGALLAPFAFLGDRWDSQMKAAMQSSQMRHLFKMRGISAINGSSIYRGTPLEALVRSCIGPDELQAIAAESARGRLLIVATTDLDSTQTIFWDMSAIAQHGGEHGLKLFRDIIVASASVPGYFPPVLMTVSDGGVTRREMHVDGAVLRPFVIFPSPFSNLSVTTRQALKEAMLYVLIDGSLAISPRVTPNRASAIVGRSISATLKQMIAQNLDEIDALQRETSIHVSVAAMPPQAQYDDTFDFRPQTLERLYREGHDCAADGRLWTHLERATQAARGTASPQNPLPCGRASVLSSQSRGALQ